MLIANMVGRNESNRYLPQVLERLRHQVDLICFTDDFSDDDTIEVAKSYGAKVIMVNEPLFKEDEGRLRTIAWRHLERNASLGDWILCIDCDEEFYPTENFSDLLEQTQYDVLGVTFYHMWNETQFRTDKAWAPSISQRLFRYKPDGIFRDRKLACGSEPTYVMELIRRGRFYPHTGLRMKHLGYVGEDDKKAKYSRYMTLDGGAYHNVNHLESILDSQVLLSDWSD